MKNKKKTSIIALVALSMTLSIPNALADTVGVEPQWWQVNPETCYQETELDDIDFKGTRSTSNQAGILSQLESTRARYNAEMGTIDILGEDGDSCSDNRRIEVGAYNFGNWWTYGLTYYSSPGSTYLTLVTVDFNTNSGVGFEDGGTSCWQYDIPLQWIANHEYGHAIGLKHHTHTYGSPDSLMIPTCSSLWSGFGTNDKPAIDIHYP